MVAQYKIQNYWLWHWLEKDQLNVEQACKITIVLKKSIQSLHIQDHQSWAKYCDDAYLLK